MSKENIIETGRKLYELGVLPEYEGSTFGNISVRYEKFLITGLGVHKGRMDEKDITEVRDVDEDKKIIYAKGKCRPSTETIVHYFIYKRFPAKAIIHVHDKLVLKYSEQIDVPKTEKVYPCGTLELAEEVCRYIEENKKYIILKNHGSIAFGENLDEAFETIKTYHNLARDLYECDNKTS